MGYHCEVTVYSFQLDKQLHSIIIYEHTLKQHNTEVRSGGNKKLLLERILAS